MKKIVRLLVPGLLSIGLATTAFGYGHKHSGGKTCSKTHTTQSNDKGKQSQTKSQTKQSKGQLSNPSTRASMSQ